MLAAGLGAMWAVRNLRLGAYALEGKTVLITGGSRGLGLALAREMMVQGAQVAICGRDPASLERAATGLRKIGEAVLAVPCDVTQPQEVESLVKQVRATLGPVDVLINNAGVIEVGPAETMSLADYEEAMATNFWGMLYPTLAVLPQMRERKSGRIVNITSIGGKLGIPHLLPYSASKFAAVGFSQGLRAEVASEGIKVVTVCPGLMRTGSPRNAIFRGRHRSEYAWFSISDALPGLSISAERAARRIVNACRRGDAEVLFPVPARVAAVLNAVAPGLTSDTLGLVDRLLPEPGRRPSGRRTGAESESWLSPSWLSRLGDRAARQYNQVATRSGDRTITSAGATPD
ncbi:MAG TPA: SDR family oxidoreductase [Gemmatimonadales bacterium]|jgi:NAD(P)-dependent dehydrogenase (short-subunit alcohol dehydrogenase family)|nr:SDR family oxidoreductase [Gemmatimonadales bacterium]